MIICGDMGICWMPDMSFVSNCNFFREVPYTVLWVQGNHENYDMLKEFAVEEWHGGKMRHIAFFTFGGASSHDIQGGILDRKDPDFMRKAKQAIAKGLPCRIRRESWWPEELPDEEEMWEGLENLKKAKYNIDYVITHCCSTSVQNLLRQDEGEGDPMYRLGETVTFKRPGGEEAGKIKGVYAFGTFEQSEEPSYDIYCEGICLYKHVLESEIIARKG